MLSPSGGDASLKMFQFILDYINAKGGALGKKFELVTFDDKLQPSEALIALKSVTDQNMPFVMSCVGSNVGSALIDAVNKHNDTQSRQPGAVAELRSAGHRAHQRAVQLLAFPLHRQRGDAGGGADQVAAEDVKSVYLLNQDYLFGQSIEHDTKRFLAQYRPDIKIVGDEIIPLMQVKDFARRTSPRSRRPARSRW